MRFNFGLVFSRDLRRSRVRWWSAMALLALVLTLGVPPAPARADGVVDSRGNIIRASVSGRADNYTPNDWMMRLDVLAANSLGQPIAGVPVTFERSCRNGLTNIACKGGGYPEQVGVTDAQGRLTYTWLERNVATRSQSPIEGAAHVYIAPEWVSVQLDYSLGTGSNSSVE